MISKLLILWHRWLISVERAELDARMADGSGSDVWSCRVLEMIIWREREIDRLGGEPEQYDPGSPDEQDGYAVDAAGTYAG